MSKLQIIRRISKKVKKLINLASTDADSPFHVKGYTLAKQEKMVNKLKKRLPTICNIDSQKCVSGLNETDAHFASLSTAS